MNLFLFRPLVFLLVLDRLEYVYSDGVLFVKQPALSNKSSTTGYDVISRSKIDCAKTCASNSTCVSFFYIPSTNLNCQLHTDVLTSADGLPYIQDAVYYVMDGAAVPTTESTNVSTADPTTAPAIPFSCPVDATIFNSVTLSDGNIFTYKIIQIKKTQAGAKAACEAEGSHLVRVTTVAKMNMTLQLIRTCPAFDISEDYYVDGSNADAQNKTAAGAWVMSNGDPVPMTHEFWCAGCPSVANEHCFRMRSQDDNHFWNDCSCSNQYYFICEI